jgi:hypothetical protein
MTSVVFWTAAGFQVGETTFSFATDMSQLLLSSLDQFFGSTDSSRAIAAIITLIRREFENPATGVQGERVGVVDLILGLCGLAYMQRWCHRLIEEECRRLDIDEVIWDVVVLSDGERIDVHEESLYGVHRGLYDVGQSADQSMLDKASNQKLIATIQKRGIQDSDDDNEDADDLPEIALRKQIMKSLPQDTQVSITTSVSTVKTITVDIMGGQALTIAPPPGVELIGASQADPMLSSSLGSGPPTYRVVYQVKRNKERSTLMQSEGDALPQSGYIEQLDDGTTEDDSTTIDDGETDSPPPLPPKSPTQSISKLKKRPISPPTSVSSVLQTPKQRVPLSDQNAENTANQKRPRVNVTTASPPNSYSAPPSRKHQGGQNSSHGKKSPDGPRNQQQNQQQANSGKPDNRKGGFRSALRKGPVPAITNLILKDDSGSDSPGNTSSQSRGKRKPGQGATKQHNRNNSRHQSNGNNKYQQQQQQQQSQLKGPPAMAQRLNVPGRGSSLVPKRDAPPAPQSKRNSNGGGNNNNNNSMRGVKSPMRADMIEDPFPRSSSRASYVSVHERRRDSIVSQTDTFSIHSTDTYYRPVTPTLLRTEVVRSGGSTVVKSRADAVSDPLVAHFSPEKSGGGSLAFRRGKSHGYSPSIYTLKTNGSEASLVPYSASHFGSRSAFGDGEALGHLRQTGSVDGMFPASQHLLRNLERYMRFASASYGSSFLKLMGIIKDMPLLRRALDAETHLEVRSFAHHTRIDAGSILLSSFVDAQGGSDSTGSTNTGVPLVHYVALDHESKAVVLACRGTLGFEDVLADMTCDYDDLTWRGNSYKVHKGIHASARRLLYGGDGRVLITLRQALEEFSDYGLVLTGHSLGGAVTALLGVMLAEPVSVPGMATVFVTASQPMPQRLLADASGEAGQPCVSLPAGRPIHVYAYGPPSTMSASLCRATRGLITSTVHGNDLVPYLSLGVLHDFQAVALAFKSDNNEAKMEVRQRIWDAFQTGVASRWYGNLPVTADDSDNQQWAYAALKTLRASMMSQKLMPPGEVFVVESTRVLRRDAFVVPSPDQRIGRPARRIVLRYVKDVEKRFREVRFGTSMLTDHSPGRYENALSQLRFGVMES